MCAAPTLPRIACGLALVLLLPGTAWPQSAGSGAQRPRPELSVARLERAIHERINGERSKHGLAPLAWDARLAAVARGHSGDMAARRYFSHDSPDGADFAARYRRGGVDCALRVGRVIHGGAENIAQGTLYASITTINGQRFYDWNGEDRLAARTVEGWMNSPGHRRNILTPHWGREGIGLSIGADERIYVTQNFC